MQFRSTNQIVYMQDWGMHVGIPAGVDFEISPAKLIGGGFHLNADGYGGDGDFGGGYGNGSLTVWSNDLQSGVFKQFQAAAKEPAHA